MVDDGPAAGGDRGELRALVDEPSLAEHVKRDVAQRGRGADSTHRDQPVHTIMIACSTAS
jgi:hypothetical protein